MPWDFHLQDALEGALPPAHMCIRVDWQPGRGYGLGGGALGLDPDGALQQLLEFYTLGCVGLRVPEKQSSVAGPWYQCQRGFGPVALEAHAHVYTWLQHAAQGQTKLSSLTLCPPSRKERREPTGVTQRATNNKLGFNRSDSTSWIQPVLKSFGSGGRNREFFTPASVHPCHHPP